MSGQVLDLQRVRVWFGEHVVVEYVAEPVRAEQYVEAMGRRFAGLRVTVDPRRGVVDTGVRRTAPLPAERLWVLTP